MGHSYNAHGHRIHYHHACTARVRATIPYMRYGVHNIELLDQFFYYDPCTSAWIVQDSSTPADEYAVHLLEQEARSSGGLSYQGIFNRRIAFCDGHWIPLDRQPRMKTAIPDCRVVEEKAPANCFAKQIAAQAGGLASRSPLHVERRAYSNTAGLQHQQWPGPKEEREPCLENRDTGMKSMQSHRVPYLKNSELHCSISQNVSKPAVHPAPPKVVQTRHAPHS